MIENIGIIQHMRVLFMGTSEFAIPALKELVAHKHEIIGVVTQPDRPSGRGKKLKPTPVKQLATNQKLQVYQPEKVGETEFVDTLKLLNPDVMVVAAFGQLLPQKVLDIPPCGVINLHPSLLPKYRGAAPIQWTLINGEDETGVTLMLLDIGEDTGDIICMERIPIELQDTAETLHQKLADIGARLLIDVLANLKPGEPPSATPQKHSEATHAPRLTKEMGCINWNKSAITIHNQIRGMAGWPGAYTYFCDGTSLKIIQSLPNGTYKYNSQEQPGTIRITSDQHLFVRTGGGEIQLMKVQPATKQVMSANDLINGYQLKTGEYFSNLESKIDDS